MSELTHSGMEESTNSSVPRIHQTAVEDTEDMLI